MGGGLSPDEPRGFEAVAESSRAATRPVIVMVVCSGILKGGLVVGCLVLFVSFFLVVLVLVVHAARRGSICIYIYTYIFHIRTNLC